jgi:hypothetical protein
VEVNRLETPEPMDQKILPRYSLFSHPLSAVGLIDAFLVRTQ